MDYKLSNLLLAIVLSVAIIFSWRHFYEKPRLEKLAADQKEYNLKISKIKKQQLAQAASLEAQREEQQISIKNIEIKSPKLAGSFSLKGLRFDNLTLNNYNENLDDDSDVVHLLTPSKDNKSYFVEFGWWGNDKSGSYPNASTIWQANGNVLSSEQPIELHWSNPQGVVFKVIISLDDNYLFTIKQITENNSGSPISAQYYGLVNRIYNQKEDKDNSRAHKGMIGAIDNRLQEYSYSDLKDSKKEHFAKGDLEWLGITDKYWLTAFIPDKSHKYSANYKYAMKGAADKYQADFISENKILDAGEKAEVTHHLFAGAKKVALLDKYEQKLGLKLFDRAIDFGWFYILTKPIFNALNFFYSYVGNFGISIMIVTVIIKLLMFTIANKSYRSMRKMKKLQPQIERIKEMYAEDKQRMNQEVMQLYKREKVNPVSGCLPLLVQIPVFFSIYKVLSVTIEMRHAPFFGWIQDLSAPDPTSILNLFGLLPYEAPEFLVIGIWPIFMAITMFLQQRMSPKPADPVQAQVMKFMPLFFLFMFSGFPAGLLIYWSWNNILSIIQQTYINKLSKE